MASGRLRGKLLPLFALFAVKGALAQGRFDNNLLPQPARIAILPGSLPITSQLRVLLEGPPDPLLHRAAERMIFRIEQRTATHITEPFTDQRDGLIQIYVADHSVQRPADGVDESYTLVIQNDAAKLYAQTDFGAMRGIETILQLVEASDSGYFLPGIHIADTPRFPWRGLMLDPGRHFLPVANVLRTLDAMAAVKMNVLHLHLTEDQGFRIESKRFPKLQELGSEGRYYTQDDIREIVQYATDRGIRVVPEFDMPGHTTSWFVGYPELASKPGPYQVEHGTGVFNPALNPTLESTYEFLDAFLGEMSTLFPDEYMHIGGDESDGEDWKSNPEIVRFMREHHMQSTNELQAYFNSRVEKILAKYHRRIVGWDEILQPDLSSDVVVQNWHGIEFLIQASRSGHRGILSQPFYLDHHSSAEQMYAADPIPADARLTAAQEKLILGGEACMWGEQVDYNTVDSRIWPRTAAVAERLWSPASVRDAPDMYRRLAVVSLQLDALGLEHISNPERGFRQLTGGDPEALRLFASVVQPVDFHERYEEQHTSPLTPMTNVVDFTVPDPLTRLRFADEVTAYLRGLNGGVNAQQHAQDRAALENTFREWVAAAHVLDSQATHEPRLAAIAQRRKQWLELATSGMDAIGFIESGKPAPEAWMTSRKALIQQSAQPQELVDFAVLDPMNELFQAASAGSNPR
jgi:hexosaminidase